MLIFFFLHIIVTQKKKIINSISTVISVVNVHILLNLCIFHLSTKFITWEILNMVEMSLKKKSHGFA